MAEQMTRRFLGGLLLVVLAGTWVGCPAKSPAPIPSPSGRYQLQPFQEVDGRGTRWMSFHINDAATGNKVFTCPERWLSGHRTDFHWDEQDRAWVLSSDVGVSVWAATPSGSWQRVAQEDAERLLPPEPIRKYHDQFPSLKGKWPATPLPAPQ
ncbi:hypothetical protein F0U60_45835 [Archangium minus]|uniref:Lipoprotein n=1 Tax=Archangium minus TaxID=83450 RepID=A0ABY9X5G4_9BACT|nr:hypothetical protein F0U60_45835 [Archangium minus]